MTRETWTSYVGFILASAGCAIGLGNIWRFPYITGENHGGAFLFVYIVIVFTIGLGLMIAEFAMGRAGKRNPVGAYAALSAKWKWCGYLGIAVSFIILSFYSVIGGWTIAYLVRSLTGAIHTSDPEELGALFSEFISNPFETILYHGLFMVGVLLLVIGGIKSGIQRGCQILMPLLFILLLILMVFSLGLEGAGAGVAFFLSPDFSKINADMIYAALSQAFFSLGVGLGALMTYASYLNRETNLINSSVWVTSLDFLVAFIAGLVVLPAVFAVGLSPSAGPGLTFVTLPVVFYQIPGATIFATFFFALLLIAALTSAISLLEVPVAYAMDEHGMNRTRATVMLSVIIFILGIPSALSFGPWAELTLLERTFFDWMDFLSSGLGLPLSALLISLFVGWVVPERVTQEATSDGAIRFSLKGPWMIMCRFIAPVSIAWILISALF